MGEHELFNGNVYCGMNTNTNFLSSIKPKPDACTSVMPQTSITVSSDNLVTCSNFNWLSINDITDTNEDKEEEAMKDEAMDLHPVKIIFNDPVSVVFWEDGEKTVVRRHEGEPYDKYVAFCAALAIKIFGSNTEVNRIVSSGIDQQKKDLRKAEKIAKKQEAESEKIAKKQEAESEKIAKKQEAESKKIAKKQRAEWRRKQRAESEKEGAKK